MFSWLRPLKQRYLLSLRWEYESKTSRNHAVVLFPVLFFVKFLFNNDTFSGPDKSMRTNKWKLCSNDHRSMFYESNLLFVCTISREEPYKLIMNHESFSTSLFLFAPAQLLDLDACLHRHDGYDGLHIIYSFLNLHNPRMDMPYRIYFPPHQKKMDKVVWWRNVTCTQFPGGLRAWQGSGYISLAAARNLKTSSLLANSTWLEIKPENAGYLASKPSTHPTIHSTTTYPSATEYDYVTSIMEDITDRSAEGGSERHHQAGWRSIRSHQGFAG